jgi:hypothetical protein
MYLKKLSKNLIIFLVSLLMLSSLLIAADKDGNKKTLQKPQAVLDGPIVDSNVKYHEIGDFWNRVTNYGKMGDDAYSNRRSGGDYPGGSGNSYLYRGSLWLTALVDGEPHSTQPEDNEWTPIDTVHLITDSERADQETFTKYYDVKSPLANGHFPLGLEVTEKTLAWADDIRNDFIIYEWTIKNVGIDTDDDGYPDTPRDIEQFYFTMRLDGDVSKLPEWAAEDVFVNVDDHAACNASWGLLEYFPNWAGIDEDFGLTDADADSTMMFMWDGDNPSVPADNGVDDDTFNPGVTGQLQTPGFLGFKVLKTIPETFAPSSFITNTIFNDPATDKEAYERFMIPKIFENQGPGVGGPSGLVINPSTGKAFPNDYRAVMSIGPLDVFATGDSVVVIAAIGVGSDPEQAGMYSLAKLFEIMKVAQYMVDIDYDPSRITVAPAPEFQLGDEYNQAGSSIGVGITWESIPETTNDFFGYEIVKSAGKGGAGTEDWQVIATYIDTAGSSSWPPPAGDNPGTYKIVDNDVINGFDYKYQTRSITNTFLFGRVSSSSIVQQYSPANAATVNLDRVKVVPNPYIGSVAWNNPRPSEDDPWEHRLQFINLPGDAVVKIFTLDLDYVAEVRAGRTVRQSTAYETSGASSVAEWDLITRNNQEAAPGIYIYVVDSPSAGQKTGKFVIVR